MYPGALVSVDAKSWRKRTVIRGGCVTASASVGYPQRGQPWSAMMMLTSLSKREYTLVRNKGKINLFDLGYIHFYITSNDTGSNLSVVIKMFCVYYVIFHRLLTIDLESPENIN